MSHSLSGRAALHHMKNSNFGLLSLAPFPCLFSCPAHGEDGCYSTRVVVGEGPVPASVTVAVLNLSKSLICHWLVSPGQDFLAELEGNLTNEYILNNEGLKTSASLVFTISADTRTGAPWMALRTKKM